MPFGIPLGNKFALLFFVKSLKDAAAKQSCSRPFGHLNGGLLWPFQAYKICIQRNPPLASIKSVVLPDSHSYNLKLTRGNLKFNNFKYELNLQQKIASVSQKSSVQLNCAFCSSKSRQWEEEHFQQCRE